MSILTSIFNDLKIKIIPFLFFLSFIAGCTEKFVPSVKSPATGYLVVEGIVNAGTGPTQITLSRTNTLNDSAELFESGATIQVEGTDSSILGLTETGTGTYSSNQLSLNPSNQYRIRIMTKDGRIYLSDFEPVLKTPPIDSINWELRNGGVQIYANTHDPLNNTHYYFWNYTETWEFHSPYLPSIKYDTTMINPVPQPPTVIIVDAPADLSNYTCWQTLFSSDLLLGSSINLSKDVIYDLPVEFIPPGSQKLSVEYSILVNQDALTQGAYQFLQGMKMNTEETGSLFDPQPSQLNGNIHCLTNTSEPVIGYLSIASTQALRIFISNTAVPGWNYESPCSLDSIIYPLTPSYADQVGLFPVAAINLNAMSFTAAPRYCVDCTLSGTNQKPSFWP
jgi:hypothetical protein